MLYSKWQTKSSQRKRKAKRQWLSEEALQIVEEQREARSKGERERYIQLNAQYQKIARETRSLFQWTMLNNRGFPGSSAGKEYFCNAGGPGSIPLSGRLPGEGIGYPLQYSWTSLVAQLVKNLPAMRETWVQFLGWEDLLEKGRATHSSIWAWRILWTPVHGVVKSQTWLSNFQLITEENNKSSLQENWKHQGRILPKDGHNKL